MFYCLIKWIKTWRRSRLTVESHSCNYPRNFNRSSLLCPPSGDLVCYRSRIWCAWIKWRSFASLYFCRVLRRILVRTHWPYTCTCAAEEHHVGYFQAWCVRDVELFCDALVVLTPQRKRSAQRGRPKSGDLPQSDVIVLYRRNFGQSLIHCATTLCRICREVGPCPGEDQHHDGERQPPGGWWFPWGADLQCKEAGVGTQCTHKAFFLLENM